MGNPVIFPLNQSIELDILWPWELTFAISDYPLVNVYITNWKITILIGKTHYN